MKKLMFEQTVEVEVKYIKIVFFFNEFDRDEDLPLRESNGRWQAIVDVHTGRIIDWPVGKTTNISEKVVDRGIYTLLDENGDVIAEIQGYVPHGLVPGRWGDYIDLNINENGIITNWPKNPSVKDFDLDVD